MKGEREDKKILEQLNFGFLADYSSIFQLTVSQSSEARAHASHNCLEIKTCHGILYAATFATISMAPI